MIKAFFRYGTFLVGVYLCVLIYSLPASFVYKNFITLPHGITAQGVSGSIWSGRLNTLHVDGYDIENLHWSIVLSDLLRGDIAIDWSIDNQSGKLSGRAQFDEDAIHLSGIKGRLDMASLSQQFSRQDFFASGILILDIEEYSFTADKLKRARGTVAWQQANLLAPVTIDLGGITTTLHENEGALLVRFVDTGYAVDLSGEVQLSKWQQYTYQLRFGVRDTTATGVVDVFNLMGLPDDDGYVSLEGEGRIQM